MESPSLAAYEADCASDQAAPSFTTERSMDKVQPMGSGTYSFAPLQGIPQRRMQREHTRPLGSAASHIIKGENNMVPTTKGWEDLVDDDFNSKPSKPSEGESVWDKVLTDLEEEEKEKRRLAAQIELAAQVKKAHAMRAVRAKLSADTSPKKLDSHLSETVRKAEASKRGLRRVVSPLEIEAFDVERLGAQLGLSVREAIAKLQEYKEIAGKWVLRN